jgi:hypothetical protein
MREQRCIGLILLKRCALGPTDFGEYQRSEKDSDEAGGDEAEIVGQAPKK